MKVAKNHLGRVIIGLVLVMTIVFTAMGFRSPPIIGYIVDDLDPVSKPQINSPAPDFTLRSLNGENININDLKGKVVIINFWATWCSPCRLEMPVFQNKFDEFSEELLILAVNSQDTAEDAQFFMDELNLSFDVLLDTSGEVHKKYQVRGFPTTYVVDNDGIIRKQHVGTITEDQLDEYLSIIGLSN